MLYVLESFHKFAAIDRADTENPTFIKTWYLRYFFHMCDYNKRN